ncbi:hypothetical protein [Halobaculum magnesiiphilum]|uniref:Uncharacterized protein n=1 Tax=Halobaculum magnesiiphilum TaxID=1017351 RepID=A0A8T8WGE1_9EURY|nr:hypothetical protein [Halobaculum magnesiiphilum]QZP38929.1 hypothetical protein K6T50_07280 [Halobaculum magnesiiphilum]
MSSPIAPAEDGGRRGEVADASGGDRGRIADALYWVRVGAYSLASLLALSLLTVGTVAIIAEIKGTWHWAIHLESTISYMGIFMGGLLALLVPLLAVSLTARVVFDV